MTVRAYLPLALALALTPRAFATPRHHGRSGSVAAPPAEVDHVLIVDATAGENTPERVYAAPGGDAAEACAQRYDVDVQGDRAARRPGVHVVLPDGPAPTPAVTPAQPPTPGPGFVWIDGYFGWTGERYVWIGGRWDLSPVRGARGFEPEHWQRTPDRSAWEYVPARWIGP